MTDVGPVERAVRADLRRLADVPPTLAEAAVAVAQTMDRTSAARDMAALARELRATYADMVKASPERPEESTVDELSAKRDARRSAAAGS